MKTRRLPFFFLVAFAALGALAAGGAGTTSVEEGRALWTENRCDLCHGEDGKADTKLGKRMQIADMSTAEWQKSHPDEAIRDVLVNGFKKGEDGRKSNHKALKGATPKQVDAVIALIRSFGPPPK